jgi:hypothetical protein
MMSNTLYYWCKLHEFLNTNIPEECVVYTQSFDTLEFLVGVMLFAFLLICIECILQANE